MDRSDVAHLLVRENVEAAPIRELVDVLAQIQYDAKSRPAEYLVETESPYGGE